MKVRSFKLKTILTFLKKPPPRRCSPVVGEGGLFEPVSLFLVSQQISSEKKLYGDTDNEVHRRLAKYHQDDNNGDNETAREIEAKFWAAQL